MSLLKLADAEIYYEIHGGGFPVLVIAPGGMRSEISFWEKAPWNPLEVLADKFQVIAMDQRNAGNSKGLVRGDHSWNTYTQDQLALLDHLQIDQCHYLGMCIGGTYGYGLMLAQPQRIRSAVFLQPMGLDNNREAFHEMFDSWVADIRDDHPEVDDEAWRVFRDNLYGGDFIFSATRDQITSCQTNTLVLQGDDLYHPQSISRDIALNAPNVELIAQWKTGEARDAGRLRVVNFLLENT